MTLIEIIVGLGLLSGILALLLGALTGAQQDLVRQADRIDTNDQARLAVQSIDREVRSGDLLYNPSSETYPTTCTPASCDVMGGYSLRVLSETNVPSPRNEKRCVQYRVTPAGELERRDWDPNWNDANDPVQVSGWRTIADGIANYPGAPAPNNVPVFSQARTNLVRVVFLANAHRGSGLITGGLPTTEVDVSVSGRNSAVVTDLRQCGPDTPDPSLNYGGSRVPPY